MFFLPWWWYVWSTGKPYSLRRSIVRTLGLGAAAGIVGGLYSWAIGGDWHGFLKAGPFALLGCQIGAYWSMLLPLYGMLRDSLAARRLRTIAMKQVSIGMLVGYAFAAAIALELNADHFAYLSHWLAIARTGSGMLGGTIRFIIVAAVVTFPFVFLLKLAILATDDLTVGAGARTPRPGSPTAVAGSARGPFFTAMDAQRRVPPSQPQQPPARPTPPQRPARIVSKDVSPMRDDRRS